MKHRVTRNAIGTSGTEGAVFVEFLIAFLPVFTFFLCLVQLALLFTARVVTEHAALNGARAAAVIIGDEKSRYNENINELKKNGKHYKAIRDAVLLTLAPLIINGVVDDFSVVFPPPDTPGGKAQSGTIKYTPMSDKTVSKVRVRVEVDAACQIALANRIACGSWLDWKSLIGMNPTRKVKAEAIFPYQGARYDYP